MPSEGLICVTCKIFNPIASELEEECAKHAAHETQIAHIKHGFEFWANPKVMECPDVLRETAEGLSWLHPGCTCPDEINFWEKRLPAPCGIHGEPWVPKLHAYLAFEEFERDFAS